MRKTEIPMRSSVNTAVASMQGLPRVPSQNGNSVLSWAAHTASYWTRLPVTSSKSSPTRVRALFLKVTDVLSLTANIVPCQTVIDVSFLKETAFFCLTADAELWWTVTGAVSWQVSCVSFLKVNDVPSCKVSAAQSSETTVVPSVSADGWENACAISSIADGKSNVGGLTLSAGAGPWSLGTS